MTSGWERAEKLSAHLVRGCLTPSGVLWLYEGTCERHRTHAPSRSVHCADCSRQGTSCLEWCHSPGTQRVDMLGRISQAYWNKKATDWKDTYRTGRGETASVLLGRMYPPWEKVEIGTRVFLFWEFILTNSTYWFMNYLWPYCWVHPSVRE